MFVGTGQRDVVAQVHHRGRSDVRPRRLRRRSGEEQQRGGNEDAQAVNERGVE
ncbi:hypothetical protein D3C71_1831410 [compost metagenome]